MTKCGLNGDASQKQDLTIDYDITPTLSVIGFPISITLRKSASFPCPIEVRIYIRYLSHVLTPFHIRMCSSQTFISYSIS